MVASAIAYFLTALFAILGFVGLHLTIKNTAGDAEKIVVYFSITIGFFAVAWGCAYIGGI